MKAQQFGPCRLCEDSESTAKTLTEKTTYLMAPCRECCPWHCYIWRPDNNLLSLMCVSFHFNTKAVFVGMGFTIVNIWISWTPYITGIPVLVRHLYIETNPKTLAIHALTVILSLQHISIRYIWHVHRARALVWFGLVRYWYWSI